MTAVQTSARQLIDSSIVLDMTVPWRAWGRIDLHRRRLNDALLRRMGAAGFTAASLTLGMDDDTIDDAMRGLAQERFRFRQRPDIALISDVGDIQRAKREGRLAVFFNMQGTGSLARELSMVEVYFRLGVRHMLLAYNQQNWVGAGCHELHDGGLSRFGRQLIREMNRVGMLVDVTHTGERTALDAIELSRAPVIASHSNTSELHQHERNLSGNLVKAIVRSGGVIGVNGVGIFLESDGKATPLSMARHLHHLAQLAGAENLGLGMDYIFYPDLFARSLATMRDALPANGGYDAGADISSVPPEGLESLVGALQTFGWSDDHIRGVLGLNFLRVCTQVWGKPATEKID